MQRKYLVEFKGDMIQNFFSSMSFGEYLRKIRKAAGLSQEKLAELITSKGHNTTPGSISNIERNYYRKQDGSPAQPHKNLVIYAAQVCGADVREALDEADYSVKNGLRHFSNPSELIAELQRQGIPITHIEAAEWQPDALDRVYESLQLILEMEAQRAKKKP